MEAESFVLLSVENREILGVEPSHLNPEAAIVTVQNQGVYVYDVFDQQCKTSYLLSPGNSFTYHAVQNPNTKKFLAVKDNKYLCSWPEEQKDLKKIGRKAYERGAIHSVWVDKFLSSHHLIIFTDGVLALGNPDLGLMPNQESAPVGTPGEVVWANLRRGDSLLFVAVVTKAANDLYTLHIHSITRPEKALEVSHLSSHKLSKPQKSKLLTCAFDADALSFTAFWSTGDMNVWTVSSAEDLTSVNDSFQIAVSRKLKLPKSTASAANGGVTAISIKSNLLLLTEPVEGSKQPKQTLMMWDTTFGVVQSAKEISTDAEAQKTRGAVSTSDSGPLAVLQASQSIDNSLVFLNLGSMVVVCPVWAPNSSLANALGRLEASKPYLAPQQHASAEHQNIDWLAPVLKGTLSVAEKPAAEADDADDDQDGPAPKPTGSKNTRVETGFAISDLDKLWQEHAVTHMQAEANAIATLRNKSKTPTFEAFMNVFNPYIAERREAARLTARYFQAKMEKGHWKNIAELSSQKSKRKKKLRLARLIRQSISFLSHNFVVQVAQRCLEEDFLWQPLRVLIESRSLPVRGIPNFLTTLMEKNQHSLLIDTMLYMSDLTEVEIVAIAKFFMSQADPRTLQICVDECLSHKNELTQSRRNADGDATDKTAAGTQQKTTDQFPQTPIEKILNVIVSAPHNPLFMTQAARRFNSAELVVLMQFLLRWLKYFKEYSYNKSLRVNNIAVPTTANIVSWASLLVDAQLSQLLYTPECRTLILDLQTSVREHIELCEAMEALRNCVAHFQTRRSRPRHEETDYTIETLL